MTNWTEESRRLKLEKLRRLDAGLLPGGRLSTPTLAKFVTRTSIFQLDPWQRHMCARLQKLPAQTGQHILIHAPPQHGKSVILSQRFPAWYIGILPTSRVKLGCYNVTHAAGFSKIVRELIQGAEFAEMFPGEHLQIPHPSSAESWSNHARSALRDAQPTFKALGLTTGFVGQGADLLLVDDPYSSPQDAFSELVNKSVQLFWEQGAKVRVPESANVVVMFHRYQEADIAGYMIEQEGLIEDGGKWELLRYPAIADGYEKWPDALTKDLIPRLPGERLSPRYSEAYYENMRVGLGWLGQFQGLPTAPEGNTFKVAKFEIVDAAPAHLRLCRAWDLAATVNGGDYTAGVLIGIDSAGIWYVLDVQRGQWGPEDVDRNILQTAKTDPYGTVIKLPQDPGQAGKQQVSHLIKLLAGFAVEALPVTGDKETRAQPFASQVNVGNVKLVRGNWNRAFIEEYRTFPHGKYDDQVDGGADGFNKLCNGGIMRVTYRGRNF